MKRFDLMLASAWCLLGLAFAAPVRADDAPGFDRPGIAFGTDTLPRGGIAWEQGLPDASWDDSEGVRTRTWVADTLLRFGLAETVELQLGADSYGGVHRRGLGARTSQHGGGDGRLSLKWVPTTGGDAFSVGVLATASLPYGQAPVGDGGHVYDLGITAAWDLQNGRSVALYLDRSWGDGGGWLFSPSYGFQVSERVAGYIEAGIGSDAQRQRVAGGGLTWAATPRLQFDVSFLRGLDADSVDWQAGVGMALYFAPRR